MRFEILGTMRVSDAAGERPLAGMRLRVILAALLAHANRLVPTERLTQFVWDGEPPVRGAVTLRSHVMRLRRSLGPEAGERIVTGSSGYLIQIDAGELDAIEFETLCRDVFDAIRSSAWHQASATASRALSLWRGTPLADVESVLLRDTWASQLDLLYAQVREAWVEAELRLGGGSHLIADLRALVSQCPLRERLHTQFMLALYRADRQAEALAAYQNARRLLIDQLGVEPGPELRRVHERILAGDADPLTAAQTLANPVSPQIPAPAPRQLPSMARHFTGRQAELDIVRSILKQLVS